MAKIQNNDGNSKGREAETRKSFLEQVEFHPKLNIPRERLPIPRRPVIEVPIRRREETMYEGEVLYLKFWNYWVRAGERADDRAVRFFPDFENPDRRISVMIADMGIDVAPSRGEQHLWEKVSQVWHWLAENVVVDAAEYGTISSRPDSWPSIDDYAAYYAAHDRLVWAACFSKAHLFASILGRVGIPRWRITIAESHHTEGGAPPTATHVFVALYIAEKWFYLDPTWVYAEPHLPAFGHRASIGRFEKVDYPHPYETIPIPLSGFTRVPLLEHP